jgi:hypothetical protein
MYTKDQAGLYRQQSEYGHNYKKKKTNIMGRALGMAYARGVSLSALTRCWQVGLVNLAIAKGVTMFSLGEVEERKIK